MPWTPEQRKNAAETRRKNALEAEERNRAARGFVRGFSPETAAQSSNAENEISAPVATMGPQTIENEADVATTDPQTGEYFPPPAAAEGGRAPDPVEETLDEERAEPTEFELFLNGLDTPTREALTEEELFVIYQDALAKALVEKKAALKKAATDKALTAARIGTGVLPKASADQIAWKARMDEVMDYTIDLPTLGDGLVDIGLRIDQKVYLHGHSYPVTRAQYESMREIVYKAQQAEMLFEGRDKRHWLRRQARGSVVSHIG